MRISIVISFLLFSGLESIACVTCNRPVQLGISNTLEISLLLKLFLPFILLSGIVYYLYHFVIKQIKGNASHQNYTAYAAVFVVLGIGLGGFIDGIVLHQVLQWHEMLSNIIPPVTVIAKSVNMFWDGIFHLFTFIITFIGINLLYRLIKMNTYIDNNKVFYGGLLLGWGLFNLVEGFLNHHLFSLHHVKEQSPNYIFWDYGFTIISILFIIIGIKLIKPYLSIPTN